jgi:hypothetical protein
MTEPARDSQPAGEQCYRVYGITLASDFPFRTPLVPADEDRDLTFTRVWHAPTGHRWDSGEPVFESQFLTDDGEPHVRLYRQDGLDVFRHAGVADYYVWPDRVVCHQHDEDATDVVELYFLSLLAGFWLECRGAAALHASAVNVNGQAVVFLATNTGGKTSLSTTLMQAGHSLLTDDFLAVTFSGQTAVGHPSFPQMRMWPDLADHFLGGHADLPQVLPNTDKRRVPVGARGLGRFCNESRPLSRLYLPLRVDDHAAPVRLEPVPPQQALIELVRESFLKTVLEKAGLHRERFARLASLVSQVPMARLVYPSGLDRLPEVCAAIVEDVGGEG